MRRALRSLGLLLLSTSLALADDTDDADGAWPVFKSRQAQKHSNAEREALESVLSSPSSADMRTDESDISIQSTAVHTGDSSLSHRHKHASPPVREIGISSEGSDKHEIEAVRSELARVKARLAAADKVNSQEDVVIESQQREIDAMQKQLTVSAQEAQAAADVSNSSLIDQQASASEIKSAVDLQAETQRSLTAAIAANQEEEEVSHQEEKVFKEEQRLKLEVASKDVCSIGCEQARQRSRDRTEWDTINGDVAVVVLTSASRCSTMASVSKCTWASRVENLLYASDAESSSSCKLSTTDVMADVRGWSNTTLLAQEGLTTQRAKSQKVFPALMALYKKWPKRKWFLLVDDESYVLLDNLATKLKSYNPVLQQAFLGAPSSTQLSLPLCGYTSGHCPLAMPISGTLMISQATMHSLVEQAGSCASKLIPPKQCDDGGAISLSMCLSHISAGGVCGSSDKHNHDESVKSFFKPGGAYRSQHIDQHSHPLSFSNLGCEDMLALMQFEAENENHRHTYGMLEAFTQYR